MPLSAALPAPAPLAPRIIAGAIDGGVVLALCGLYFLVPLLTRGLVLPMWGVLAAVLGYLVVPLAAFKATLGMRLFGLELVGKDGHPVGAGDVLFRELIGRGFFPAAFLVTVVAGLIASYFRIASFAFPSGLGLLFFTASAFALGFAVLGHALVLNRDDRRSLADLMARSFVRVATPPSPPPADPEERADWRADRRRKRRNVVLFELVLVVGALALPWVLTQPTESTVSYAARLKRQQLEARAKANPEDEVVLSELARAWSFEGKGEQAAEVERALGALQLRNQARRLQKLKERVEASPGDERALVELLDAYDERGQLAEAKAAYRRFVEASSDLELRAGFGRWLWTRGLAEEGLAEVRAVQKAAPGLEGLHSLIGRILADTDRLEEAQAELFLATVEDPEDSEALEALEQLDAQLGPLSAARQKQLKAELEKARPR